MSTTPRGRLRRTVSASLALAGAAALVITGTSGAFAAGTDNSANTTTPIKHVVVIFGENISFDHYFGTYPKAANTDGTTFTAAANTPAVNNLVSANLLTTNPNSDLPTRLTPDEAITCDQNHSYVPEQKAFDGGKMDAFVQNTSTDTCTGQFGSTGLAMDYYDGNTVTGLWNYAQNYAMSDNSFDSVFGPSTPGALDLIAGQDHGGTAVDPKTGAVVTTSSAIGSLDKNGEGTVYGDADPAYDDCSDLDHTSSSPLVKMQGKNIGDLLNTKNVTWGWFQGGFKPTTAWDGKSGDYAKCDSTTANVSGATPVDYSPHHSPFQYYASTSNPHHLPPTSEAMIGHTDQANHQYDISDFNTALTKGNVPAVSYLKAPEAEDGHASYSDPLDEQKFIVNEINSIEKSSAWPSTAIVLAYDDSDGWYDHVAPTILNGSKDSTLGDQAMCTNGPAAAGGYADRCGPGPRQPLVVVSPYSKQNFVDHTETEQTSILKFVEDNWSAGRIGDSSFDERAGTLNSMFDFTHPQQRAVILGDDGSVSQTIPVTVTPPSQTAPGGSASAPAASNPSATPAAAAKDELADTGLDTTIGLSAAVLLLGAGVAVTLVFRRRRHLSN